MTAGDAQLLERFIRTNDEAAFETLVTRHGPMVLGVCRRVLQDRHAAEDASQATFLVLARNAGSIRRPDALGSWLYGVAYRVAARLQRSVRRSREKPAGELPDVVGPQGDPLAQVVWQELQPLLDEELNHLPEKYRVPLVLCELQGKSNVEAARELGWPASSLSSRLTRARELLRGRLASRGVALSSAMLFPLLGEQARAVLPAPLLRSTVKAATLLMLGQSALVEGVSPSAVALAEGMVRTMMMTKLKIAAAVLLAVGLLGMMVGIGLSRGKVEGPSRPAPPDARAAKQAPKADAGPVAADPQPQPEVPDPVAALRQALMVPVRDPSSADERNFRRTNLEKHARALRTLVDLQRSLALDVWKDEDRDMGAVDQPVRKELGDRLMKGVRELVKRGDAESQLAAIALIGQMGVELRETSQLRNVGNDQIVVPQNTGFARTFGPDLAELTRTKDPAVREAAARALGKINADHRVASAALDGLLRSGTVSERRAAAQELTGMVHVITLLAKGRSPYGVEATREEVIEVAQSAVPVAARGIADADAQVRQLSLAILPEAARAVAEMTVSALPAQEFPPKGRQPSPDELKDIERYQAELNEERALLLPLIRALGDQVAAASKALSDADPAVAVSACQALEALGTTRLRLVRKEAQIPEVVKKVDGYTALQDLLGPKLRATVPGLAALVTHPDQRLRLGALYALETLEADAAPAVAAVVKALRDVQPFVRWAAVRVVGKMAPQHAEQVVPALADLLDDPSADVRITTAAALKRYGPAARSAVLPLCRTANHTDATLRIWSIRALTAIGAESQAVVPALVNALTAEEASVRLEAAQALGKFGPSARSAVPALRKALLDSDPDVRQAASAALVLVR